MKKRVEAEATKKRESIMTVNWDDVKLEAELVVEGIGQQQRPVSGAEG